MYNELFETPNKNEFIDMKNIDNFDILILFSGKIKFIGNQRR